MAPQRETHGSVIHDLGYRGYDGTRDGLGAIAGSLYLLGIQHAFGLRRSGRSKVLPFLLLAINLVPAAIMVGIVTFVPGLGELPVDYARYPAITQVLLSIFLAAQAPVLFSRDLRFGSIVLYFARPLAPSRFALVRWASLSTAALIFIVLPQVLLYGGALLAEMDVSDQSIGVGQGLLLAVPLAGMLAALTGLISCYSVRRGFAVVASIIALVVVSFAVTAVQGISLEVGNDRVAGLAGLFSPYSLYLGWVSLLDPEVNPPVMAPPEGVLAGTAFVLVPLVGTLLALVLILRRFERMASR